MPQPISIQQTPLDTLVISQITEIRKRESALQERLGCLSPQAAEKEQVSFAREMRHLQLCAERLSRMVDAMGGCWNQIA